ncbi:hypothetical protein HYALB_00011100 [Hymenoscyphus albidus]|uniref:FCP1 homology domain-containing protein n=1 Tax=Hymenoscyphus albidus TaxID=595503 RepID=A0A9N9LS00_9HELO|nr:hypothetical protein HYALB_00011100 [Hymenoscyphus albidus]
MSNEIVQPTEQSLSRSASTEGTKGKPPALDTSAFTNTSQPPSSSTQTTAQGTTNTENYDPPVLQNENDYLQASDDPKKNRSHLHVPSRSSSQKVQPSPTSTGLSGVTASDPRDSISGRSKESKGSILGRRRHGSTSSSKMSTTQGPSTGPAGNSTIISATPIRQPKKKSSILSFLSCCIAPDDANPVDGGSAVPANKISKVPSGRPMTASRPDQATINQQSSAMNQPQTEKEAFQRGDPVTKLNGSEGLDTNMGTQNTLPPAPAPPTTNGDLSRPGNTREQSSPEVPSEAESSKAPEGTSAMVTTPEPTRSSIPADSSRDQKDAEGDVKMSDPEPISQKDEASIPGTKDESVKQVLPPPPPVPQQPGPSDEPAPDSTEQKQQWLLPPIAPRFQGKKCLVLDLDETLVHSSFKILHQADFTIPVEIEGQYHNVYVIKRPGVDQFMKRVGELYEVVVFTASVSKYGDPLLDQLDIHNVVHHRLFRESCYNHQGNYVKNLSQVGRDLRETIIIDNSPTSYIFHPQHAVPISSWFSDAHDNELLDLIPVLEDLAGSQVRDVSLVLDVAL